MGVCFVFSSGSSQDCRLEGRGPVFEPFVLLPGSGSFDLAGTLKGHYLHCEVSRCEHLLGRSAAG